MAVRVDVWSDVACPWCWLGHAHLMTAAKDAGIPIEIVFHSFQLAPQQSAVEPVAAYLARKYGDSAMIEAAQERLREMGARVGLPYDFSAALAANTRDAHRLHHFAMAKGRGKEVMEALFSAQHAKGADVSDHGVLQAIGEAAGLQGTEVAEVLASDAYGREVDGDIVEARRLGITGVPFFVLDRRLALSGAQPIAAFAEALGRVAQAQSETRG